MYNRAVIILHSNDLQVLLKINFTQNFDPQTLLKLTHKCYSNFDLQMLLKTSNPQTLLKISDLQMLLKITQNFCKRYSIT